LGKRERERERGKKKVILWRVLKRVRKVAAQQRGQRSKINKH